MIRYILLVLVITLSLNIQAFEWRSYHSELELASDLNNAQFITKFTDTEEARKRLQDLLNVLSNNDLIVTSGSTKQFLLGLAHLCVLSLNRLTVWSHVGTKGSEIWLNSKEFKTQNAIITDHYVKGLNHAIESGEKIDPQWLYIITASTILDTQVREAVIRYEMHQNQTTPPTETYFWDSYSSIYEAYLNKKDYENAQRILDEMVIKFPQKKEKVETAQTGLNTYIEKHAEKIKADAAKADKTVKKSVQETVEKVKMITNNDVFEAPSEAKNTEQRAPIDQTAQLELDPRIKLYGPFILGFLVLLGMYLFNNRKRKK